VLHVPEMPINLISGSLLMKASLELTLVYDRLVTTFNGEFVREGFYLMVVLLCLIQFGNTNAILISYGIPRNMWGGNFVYMSCAS